MLSPSMQERHWLAFAALSYVITTMGLFFVGLLAFGFTANDIVASLEGEAELIFDKPDPFWYPLQTLAIIILMGGPFLTSTWFSYLRVFLFIPRGVVRQSLFVLHICMAALTVQIIVALIYGVFFALDEAEAAQAMRVFILEFFLFIFFAVFEHIMIGLWMWQQKGFPSWLIFGTLIPSIVGFFLSFMMLNPALPAIRIFIPTISGFEIVFWMFYLFFWVPKEAITSQSIHITR